MAHDKDFDSVRAKLTPAQARMLRAIVKTNGGGIHSLRLHSSTMANLIGRGFIQGKKSRLSVAVHTPEGLAWVRANPESAKDSQYG